MGFLEKSGVFGDSVYTGVFGLIERVLERHRKACSREYVGKETIRQSAIYWKRPELRVSLSREGNAARLAVRDGERVRQRRRRVLGRREARGADPPVRLEPAQDARVYTRAKRNDILTPHTRKKLHASPAPSGLLVSDAG